MFESKKVMFELDVDGDELVPGSKDNFLQEVNATLDEYLEKAEQTEKSVRKVRGFLARARHQQWWTTTRVRRTPYIIIMVKCENNNFRSLKTSRDSNLSSA